MRPEDSTPAMPTALLAELDELEQFLCLREWRRLTDEDRASRLRLHARTVAHCRTLANEFMALLDSGSTIPQAIARLDAVFLQALTATGGTLRPEPFAEAFAEALDTTAVLQTRATRLAAARASRRRAPRPPHFRDRA